MRRKRGASRPSCKRSFKRWATVDLQAAAGIGRESAACQHLGVECGISVELGRNAQCSFVVLCSVLSHSLAFQCGEAAVTAAVTNLLEKAVAREERHVKTVTMRSVCHDDRGRVQQGAHPAIRRCPRPHERACSTAEGF